MAGVASRLFDPRSSFNWIFLVELLVGSVLTLFFLFYFNRLFATLVSYGIRAYTWHKYRVYVDIQALQISLLGGRIFFKGFRYHGENETIHIQNGYITWNYWLRVVKQTDCARCVDSNYGQSVSSQEEQRTGSQLPNSESCAKESGSIQAAQNLPSRISVTISGLEWFIYNRSPAYEAIAASQRRKSKQDSPRPSTDAPLNVSDSETTRNVSSEGGSLGSQHPQQFPGLALAKSTSGDFSKPVSTDAKSKSRPSIEDDDPEDRKSVV